MTIARRPGEPPLGNPDADGKVLSSTTAGVRSWVAPGSEVLSSVTLLSTDHPASWSADADTNVLTSSAAHGLVVGTPIAFGAGTGALPAGLAAEPEFYYVIEVPTTTTLKVSLTFGGAAVDITDAGTAGWVVKNMPRTTDATGIQLTNLTVSDCLDVYVNISFPRGAGTFPKVSVPSAAVYTSIATLAGTGAFQMSTLSSASAKYSKLMIWMHVERLTDDTFVFKVSGHGVKSNSATYASGNTALIAEYGGLITGVTDITTLSVSDAFGDRCLSGATGIAVRRP